MQMNCPDCGNPLEKGAQFCPKCFARVPPPSLWRRFLSLFQTTGQPSRCVVNLNKTVSVKTTDEDCQQHEYHSLDELPPELRAEVDKLEAGALKESVKSERTIISRTIDGQRHKYHSLDELPPELRAEVEKLETEPLKESVKSTRTFISRTTSKTYKIKDAAGNERIYHSLDEMPPEIRAALEQAQKKIN